MPFSWVSCAGIKVGVPLLRKQRQVLGQPAVSPVSSPTTGSSYYRPDVRMGSRAGWAEATLVSCCPTQAAGGHRAHSRGPEQDEAAALRHGGRRRGGPEAVPGVHAGCCPVGYPVRWVSDWGHGLGLWAGLGCFSAFAPWPFPLG